MATWWVGRDAMFGKEYVISDAPLQRLKYGKSKRNFFTCEDDTMNRFLEICPRFWHRAGGLCLNLGEGPVKVELTLRVRRLKK